MTRVLEALNLALLALLPLAWTAPLARAGLLPWFGTEDISIFSAVAGLWADEPALSALVALLAVGAPLAKVGALAVAFRRGLRSPRAMAALDWLGKLAMTDVFLVAVAIVVAKGVGVGRVETAWGLWLYAALVLAHMALVQAAKRRA